MEAPRAADLEPAFQIADTRVISEPQTTSNQANSACTKGNKNLKDCLRVTTLALKKIEVRKDILGEKKYEYLYSVEEVNRLVLKGISFRDAYKTIGMNIENDNFTFDKNISHTHEGSLGNLCNNQIKQKMNKIYQQFDFEKIENQIAKLLS